jgi:hypothetical protein
MNNHEAVTRLFGFATVRKALDNREAVTSYGLSNALLVSDTMRTISTKLQISESSAIAYCQNLDTELQHCLICSLLQNLTDDILQTALQDV